MGQKGPIHLKAQNTQTIMDQISDPIECLDQIKLNIL